MILYSPMENRMLMGLLQMAYIPVLCMSCIPPQQSPSARGSRRRVRMRDYTHHHYHSPDCRTRGLRDHRLPPTVQSLREEEREIVSRLPPCLHRHHHLLLHLQPRRILLAVACCRLYCLTPRSWWPRGLEAASTKQKTWSMSGLLMGKVIFI